MKLSKGRDILSNEKLDFSKVVKKFTSLIVLLGCKQLIENHETKLFKYSA
jgi:hypothetical protein